MAVHAARPYGTAVRVLAITNMFPPHHYGGYELLCADVLDRFRAAGHDVAVLTSDTRVPGVDDRAGEASNVERSLALYWDDHEIVEPGPLGRLQIERHDQRVLRRVLDEFRPDVVSVWAMGCLPMGLLATVADRGIPMVSVVCDDWLVYGPRVDAWHRAMRRRPVLDRILSRLAGVPRAGRDVGSLATHCFISETTEAAAVAGSPYALAERTVVYAGIDTDDFPVGAASSETPPSSEKPSSPTRPADEAFGWRLLHVGRLDPRKGIDVVIRALSRLPPEATLTILGRGDDAYRRHLCALVDELGLGGRVHFEVAERHQLAERYAAADVFVFAPRWSEPFGLVPLEAMACRTPVVATATGGSGEYLIDGRTCLRVPVDDDAAVADAIQRLADNPVLRGDLVERGTRLASALTMDRWAALLEQWHRHVVDPSTTEPDDQRGIVAGLVG